MIGKRGKLLIFLYMIFLIVLFLMCSTDLIIREPEQGIYQVAVIIEDVRDDNYSNFRRGMDQAAVEFNADVHFITLYEKLDADQQMELISREQQDGAEALIVMPVDERKLSSALEQKQIMVPMVLLSSGVTGEEIIGTITSDYEKMGQHLTQQMLGHVSEDCVILIFSETGNRSIASRYFLDGITRELDNGGCQYEMVMQKEGGFRKVMKSLEGKRTVILAESPEILTEAAGAMADDPALAESVQGLYGRGSTLAILNYLDRGLITGICVTDEFSMGYFSVRMTIQKLEGLEIKTPMMMDYYYIEKKDLRESAYEKMLFPIE